MSNYRMRWRDTTEIRPFIIFQWSIIQMNKYTRIELVIENSFQHKAVSLHNTTTGIYTLYSLSMNNSLNEQLHKNIK